MDLTVGEGAPERGGFFLVDIERFQGPLDLLLHLIRTQDIDILDIPIARITDQFLVAIQELAVDDLDGAGEFLEMAATLVRIKAQMLLPRPAEEEEEDPRAELVRRLLEYEQIREVTHRMRVAEAERGRRFAKGYVPVRPKKPEVQSPLETTWEEVYEAALGVELPHANERTHRVTPRTVSMEEKSVLILDALKESPRVEFSGLVSGFGERMHGVMTLLAGLELGRRRLLILRQTRPFADLWLYRREGTDDESEPVEAPDDPEAEGAHP
ncbi:MAG: segregation/condensation protein A [Gemmatimonadota bacterium]|nr:segregation/condensation protein A [Gemmatimonadota bacterium]